MRMSRRTFDNAVDCIKSYKNMSVAMLRDTLNKGYTAAYVRLDYQCYSNSSSPENGRYENSSAAERA